MSPTARRTSHAIRHASRSLALIAATLAPRHATPQVPSTSPTARRTSHAIRHASRSLALIAATLAPLHADAAAQTPADAARVAEHVTLRWDAPEPACPHQEELASRLRSFLGADPVQLAATGRVRRLADGQWRLDLELRWAHRDDLRTLHAGDCRSLADATFVLVAVLAAPLIAAQRFVDTDATPDPAPEQPAPEPEPPAPIHATPATPATPAIAARPAPRTPHRWSRPLGPFMRVAAALGHGALPGGDFGVTIAAGGLLPRLRLEAAATFLAPRAVNLPDASGHGGKLGLTAIAARACPRLLGGALELALCGSLEAGLIPARSLGYTPQRRSQGPWLALGLGGALAWWFTSRVALHVGVDAMVAPILTSYRLGEDPLFTQRRLGVRAGLGLTVALTARRSPGWRTRP